MLSNQPGKQWASLVLVERTIYGFVEVYGVKMGDLPVNFLVTLAFCDLLPRKQNFEG